MQQKDRWTTRFEAVDFWERPSEPVRMHQLPELIQRPASPADLGADAVHSCTQGKCRRLHDHV